MSKNKFIDFKENSYRLTDAGVDEIRNIAEDLNCKITDAINIFIISNLNEVPLTTKLVTVNGTEENKRIRELYNQCISRKSKFKSESLKYGMKYIPGTIDEYHTLPISTKNNK